MLLSVVSPLLNEAGNLEPLYHELKAVFKRLQHFAHHEIIFVNDGSTDASLAILKNLAALDPAVKIISFTRNFGHENATHAGLWNAQGDAVVLIDADRQDPPELILEFEKAFIEGYAIVYGQRPKRESETWLKKATSKAFYPIFKALTRIDMPYDVGDFCMLSRAAISCIKQMPEKTLFIRGLIYWSGLPKKAVNFVRRGRGSGASKYNYTKLTTFALENIISFSSTPLYAMLFFSAALFVGSLLGSILTPLLSLTRLISVGSWVPWALYFSLLFSALLCGISLVGIYIGKALQEIKQRPLYLISEKVNFTPSTQHLEQHPLQNPVPPTNHTSLN